MSPFLKEAKSSRLERLISFLISLSIFISLASFWVWKNINIQEKKANGSEFLSVSRKILGEEEVYKEGVVGFPELINPLITNTSVTGYGQVEKDITYLVFSSLIKDSRNEFIPDLALSLPNISEDGKVYEFTLKQNVFWHDGERFSVDDVIYTFETLKSLDFPAGEKRAIWENVTIEKINDFSVKFTLPDPNPKFLQNFTQGIVPEHLLSDSLASTMATHIFNYTPIGTGPYKYQSRLTNSEIVLERNASYFGKIPEIEKFHLIFFPDQYTLYNSFNKEEIDGFLGEIKMKSEISQEITINNEKDLLFTNAKTLEYDLRRFIHYKIRVSIDESTIFEGKEPTFGSGEEELKNNLISSGYSFDTNGEIRKNDFEVELIFLAPKNQGGYQEIIDVLDNVGFKITLLEESASIFWEKVHSREYDMVLTPTSVRSVDPYLFFHTNYSYGENGLNLGRLENREIDILIESNRADPNNIEIKDEMEQKILNQYLVINLGERKLFYNSWKYPDIESSIPSRESRFLKIAGWYTWTNKRISL